VASRVTIQGRSRYVTECVECGQPCFYTGWAELCDRVGRMWPAVLLYKLGRRM